MTTIDFEKGGGLVPAIIQDSTSMKVLMLGFMNREAYEKTIQEKKVTFFSRTKNRLWTKGETSGNFLHVVRMAVDCDQDTLLVEVQPEGPACHTGSVSCFPGESPKGFVYQLEEIIRKRIDSGAEDSYTNKLYRKGINKVAQKVGEESTELIIEAMGNDDMLFRNEAADLLFHLLILLKMKNCSLSDIEEVLAKRKK